MNASIKGTPNATNGSSVTIPTHAVGDDIYIFAFRDGSTTIPSKPSASGTVPVWGDIESSAGANSCSLRLAHFVATATNHTSGKWTNATGMIAVVVQNQAASPIGAHGQGGGTSSTLATAPSVTQQQTTGKALILEFYGHRTVTAWSTAPSGYTRQASYASEVCLNSKDSSTSDGSVSQNLTASSSSGYRAATLEILSTETSPTVALSSPSDTATGVSTTPNLTFTGTDAEGDDVRYEVQVDTVNTFDSQSGGSAVLCDSYSESNIDTSDSIYGSDHVGAGQTFTGNGKVLRSAKMWMKKTGSPTGTATFQIYAISGTYGTDSIPTGSALATSGTIDVSTLDGTLTGHELTFSGANKITLGNGTHYALVCYYDGGDASNKIEIGTDSSSTTHSGNEFYHGPSYSPDSTYDTTFYIYTDSGTPIIDAVSGTDAGFSGSPDNSDPFASGQAVTYTVQSALSNSTTYYWRARGKDPLGSNTYGSWATTRSFTTTSGASGPSNVKTWNGIALSSVKTINGVAIANIKSINGII